MSTQPNPNQQLEVLERNEVYEGSDEGFQFAGTLVVYQMKGYLYHAMLKARYSSPWNVNAEDFENIIQIPSSAYNPKFSVDFTPAPQTLPNNYFVKKPQLISYDRISQGPRPDSIAEDLLKEARIYEHAKHAVHTKVSLVTVAVIPSIWCGNRVFFVRLAQCQSIEIICGFLGTFKKGPGPGKVG
ncbi:uncharacterized protein N7479_001773 [Penicillium vulpinum]|nr:uncharacterized protein N7479_001773 [Penicillium vulpinum]KAJ5971855.1 hypothetical protein N7479_001773 [Penicillium vulpinum]